MPHAYLEATSKLLNNAFYATLYCQIKKLPWSDPALASPGKNYCPGRAAGTRDREMITAGKSREKGHRQIRPSACEPWG